MVADAWNILTELAPWLLVGAAVAGALHALLPPDLLRRHLGGRWGVFKAAAIGVPLPLCSCAVIPVGLSLRKQGATRGATTAFLISTPQTGVDSIFVSGAALGWPFAILKVASALIIGLVGGLLTDLVTGPDQPVATDAPLPHRHPMRSRGRDAVDHAVMTLRAIWRWLVAGILISAAITAFAPSIGLGQLDRLGTLPAMLVALAIGAPLYVCATASVPIAAALVHQGLPPAAALVFLIAGPATNVATMGAVSRSLGGQALVVYLSVIAVGSLACGWAFDSLLRTSVGFHAAHVHSTPVVGTICASALLAMFAWFAWQEWRDFLRRPPASPPRTMALDLPVLTEHHEHH